jgi:tetratricopeptide (TPR) repeat protein
VIRPLLLLALLALSACSVSPFRSDPGHGGPGPAGPAKSGGAGPVLETPTGEVAPQPAPETAIEPPPAPVLEPVPRERPKRPPATLSPASRALVTQAETQRKKGDLPGASVTLDRAMRIEPNNPLLWIEMGRLRMDQRNYPQAENMGRKALSMSVGDNRTQAAAWQLIGDSFRARGKNPQAQAAYDKAAELSPL